jgi:drug/metabolite transporter (DMT)-like permease
VLKDDDVYLVSLVQFATVALLAGCFVLMLPLPHVALSSPACLSVAYCALFPTVFCFTIQNAYQRYVTATRAGLIYTLDPVWSLIAGFFVLGERLSAREWLGCGIIFMAVVIPLGVRYLTERRMVRRYAGTAADGA